MLNKKTRKQAADSLYQADQSRTIIAQLSKTYEGIELADAYAIQQMWLDKRIDDGAKLWAARLA